MLLNKKKADTNKQHELFTSGFKSVPKYRGEVSYGEKWLQALKDEDGIYPYWRIHNKLYDLTDFIHTHPGGKFWLEATQGLDITEAFESSHLSDKPNDAAKKYYVKDILTERTSPFTFEENGFYRTLKRKVVPIIKNVKIGPDMTSLLIQDSLFITFLSLAIWGCYIKSYVIMCLAGLVLTFTANCAHNFFHQKDNIRMYVFDFTLMSSIEWRYTHSLLHHVFPNTIHDFEAYSVEPFMKLTPTENKNFFQRYLSWTPINLFTFIGLLMNYIIRGHLFLTGKTKFQYPFLIQPALLIMMTIITQSLVEALGLWLTMHLFFNYMFCIIAYSAAHNHYEAFMEGDKYIKDKDWGLLQISSIVERKTVSTSGFLTAVLFGHHTLHHLFPTVDHSKLPYLLDPFIETCNEFGVDIKLYTEWDVFKGYFWRLANMRPNIHVLQKFRNIHAKNN